MYLTIAAQPRLLVGNRADTLLELARAYREQVRVGIEGITAEPQTEREAKRQEKFKLKIIDALVTKVEVTVDKEPMVYTELDFAELSTSDTSAG